MSEYKYTCTLGFFSYQSSLHAHSTFKKINMIENIFASSYFLAFSYLNNSRKSYTNNKAYHTLP